MSYVQSEEELNYEQLSSVYLKELKEIDEAGVMDLIGGKGLVWIMKGLIIAQDERISQLEFLVAELRGEVEPEEDQKLSL